MLIPQITYVSNVQTDGLKLCALRAHSTRFSLTMYRNHICGCADVTKDANGSGRLVFGAPGACCPSMTIGHICVYCHGLSTVSVTRQQQTEADSAGRAKLSWNCLGVQFSGFVSQRLTNADLAACLCVCFDKSQSVRAPARHFATYVICL